MTRATRNNNPLNIRRSGDRWLGLAPEQSDPEFCRFVAAQWGWRAALALLTRTYYGKHGLDTPRAIIGRWAPPDDGNDTKAYIRAVCIQSDFGPDEPLGPPDEHPTRWLMLALAMARVECAPDRPDALAMLQGWQLLEQDNDRQP